MKNLPKKDNYFFMSDDVESIFRTAIVIGVNRSGKTTLGNMLATSMNVEHLDESLLLFTLPTLVRLKIIDPSIGRGLFLTYLKELMNDTVLLRRANFRPDDLSSIWLQKKPSEIFSRLITLKSRTDVNNYIKLNKPFSLLTLSESGMCNLSTIVDFLPTSKIIHVVRNGIDVAHQIYKKKWFFDEQLIKPDNAQIYRSIKRFGQITCVPWWVKPGDERIFLRYSEFERGLFYWCVLMEDVMESLKRIKNDYIQVKYEDILNNPQKIVQDVSLFLGTKTSSMTAMAIKDIEKHKKISDVTPNISKNLIIRAGKIYKFYDYKF